MAVRIRFDNTHNIIPPTFVLANRSGENMVLFLHPILDMVIVLIHMVNYLLMSINIRTVKNITYGINYKILNYFGVENITLGLK